jgi:hypothetical protein
MLYENQTRAALILNVYYLNIIVLIIEYVIVDSFMAAFPLISIQKKNKNRKQIL